MATSLYGFSYTERALAFLEMIQPKLRRQCVKRVQELSGNPFPHNCKMLQGKSDEEEKVYRIRSGDYRILYVVRNNPDQIIVLDIGHRKDIYK